MQARLLRALWPLLAPGGLLVYATCSILRRENGAQIDAFRAWAATIEAAPEDVASLQLLPEEAGGDGFYYACLKKPPVLRMPSGPPSPP